MRLRRTLVVLLLVTLIAALVAGCATPRTQSPAENTEDRDRDGLQDDAARAAGDNATVDDNVTAPTPLYNETPVGP